VQVAHYLEASDLGAGRRPSGSWLRVYDDDEVESDVTEVLASTHADIVSAICPFHPTVPTPP
jgi:hypothetical protein